MQRKTYETITWLPHGKGGELITGEWDTRFRRDRGGDMLYRHVYNALKANGLLDTRSAWKAVNELECIAAREFENGASHRITIGNTGYVVEYSTHYTS